MSLKRKKMRKIARNAAMSALIVSAIVGTSVVASAADNHSTVSTGQVLTVLEGSAVKTATTLSVTGGTVYVGATSSNGFDIAGDVRGTTVTNGGKIFIGKTGPGAADIQSGAKMTTDNLTINGGDVTVTNASTLTSRENIDIANGTLYMAGTFTGSRPDSASGSKISAKYVNIYAGGTLHAVGGLQNVVDTTGAPDSAVNLRGGTINVAETAGAALTIGGVADSSAQAGHLYVANGYTLNSYSGTIKANLVSKGTTNFKSGTTTVDNMTVSDGTTKIEGNATVNVVGDKPELTGGTLQMAGGTLSIKGGEGTLLVKGGTLHSSANVNTVAGSIEQSGGAITVNGGSTLNITKNLTVTGGTATINGGATMSVAGTTKLAASSVTVGSTTSGDTGILSITKESLFKKDSNNKYAQNTDIVSGAISLSNSAGSGASATHEGVLILTGWSGEVDLDTQFASGYLDGVTNGVLGKTLTGNNVILMGATIKGVAAKLDGGANNGFVAYGSAVTVNAATGTTAFTNTGTIIVPKLVAGAGVAEYKNDGAGKTTLVGTGATDSQSTFTKYTQSGTGATTVTGGAGLTAGTLGITGGSVNIEAGSALGAGTLDITGGQLNVLNSKANIATLKGTGGTLFIDPAYVTIGGIEGKLGTQLLTGVGSVLSIGGAAGWMEKPMHDAGFAFRGTNQAVLGIAPKGTIAINTTGVVVVDPTAKKDALGTGYELTYKDATNAGADKTVAISQATTGAFWAGNGSLTIIDAAGLDGKPVFDLKDATNKVVNIGSGAKLHVANLTVKGLQIFSTSDGSAFGINAADGRTGSYDPTAANAGWAGKNLIQPDRMLTASMTNTGKLGATVNNASFALGMSSEFNDLMYGVWGNALNNTNSPNAGIRLVSRAASTDYGLSALDAAKTIEGAAQLGAVAGVQGVTISAANSATSAVATRTSFAQPLLDKTKAVAMSMDSEGKVSMDSGLSAGDGMKNGLALWIMPLYQSNNVWGQKAGNFKSGYNSDLGGIAAGVDYTVNDMFRFGAALNIGGGYSQSSGDFASTDNSFNFWGVNLYGGWTMNNFGLSADVGYTGNYNKVEQDAPASLGMSNFKSDINSSAWTAGLKAEYKLETSVLDIIPHIGVRYMGLTTDQYDVKGGGGTVFDVEQDFQSIWTFPIGVALSKSFETGSGWVFKPQMDLSVIPAAGDVKAKSKSKIPGAPGSAEAKMQVVDYVTFDGGVGFDFGNENLNFGLNYNIQASEHRTGHGVFGTIRYEF